MLKQAHWLCWMFYVDNLTFSLVYFNVLLKEVVTAFYCH
jgi:hypothetical protein